MAIEEALFTRLSGFSGLSALVSTRIYPVKKGAANPSFPFITYERISSEPHSAMVSDTGDNSAEWRFHAWAKDTDSAGGAITARNVIRQVAAALQRFYGSAAGTEIKGSFVVNEFDLGEDDPGVYHRVIDLRITHAE